jgi:hypothetical protein
MIIPVVAGICTGVAYLIGYFHGKYIGENN